MSTIYYLSHYFNVLEGVRYKAIQGGSKVIFRATLKSELRIQMLTCY